MDKKMKIYIVVIVVVLVLGALVYNFYSVNSNLQTFDNQPVSQTQITQLESASANTTLAKKIGIGVIGAFPTDVNGTPIIINGKPTVLYIGAEFCPYCAATRWQMIIAFMRFGNFTGLKYMTSDPTDVYGGTPTFTFYNSTYESQYVNFIPVEQETNTGAPLQQPSAWENTTYARYDTGGIPFIDFGNKSIQGGADYSPGLIYRLSWTQILSQLNNVNSSVAQSIIGGANIYTAHICAITNFTPASVCDAPYIKQALNLSK
jgi:hypothetical protein